MMPTLTFALLGHRLINGVPRTPGPLRSAGCRWLGVMGHGLKSRSTISTLARFAQVSLRSFTSASRSRAAEDWRCRIRCVQGRSEEIRGRRCRIRESLSKLPTLA